MSDRVRNIPAAALLLVVAAGCGRADGATTSAAADTAAAVAGGRTIVVETVVVEPQSFVDELAVTGTVEADRDVTVASEESGVVRAVLVDKGRRVGAGQPIARLDDAVIRAQYDQAMAEAALAKETWERQRRLWEEDRIGSEMAYLRARYGAETAEAAARVLAARLARTTVRAPIAGILEDRFVEVGTNVMPGSPVARVVDLDPVKVVAGVPERYAGEIRVGTTVHLTFDRADGRTFEGRATYVGAAVDPRSRTFPVEVAVANAGDALKPGVVARLRIARRTLDRALLLPREAVVRGENGYAVYVVVRSGGRAIVESRPVTTGAGASGRVVIESGLAAGDEVVVVGQQQVTAGDVVEVANRAGGGL